MRNEATRNTHPLLFSFFEKSNTMNQYNIISDHKPSSLPSSSSSSRWRSDILQPVVIHTQKCNDDDNDGTTIITASSYSSSIASSSSAKFAASSSLLRNNDNDNDSMAAVIIPWSGWYGFFFQISNNDDKQQQLLLHHHASFIPSKRDTIMTATTDNDDDVDGIVARNTKNGNKANGNNNSNKNIVNDNIGSSSFRFRLRVSWKNRNNNATDDDDDDDDDDDETTTTHNNERFIPLPLTTDMSSTSLATLAVGKLVYFAQASRVSVVMSSSSAATAADSSTTTLPTSQWQLVFQRHLGKTEEKRSVHDTGTIGDDSVGCSRCFMCGLCGKTTSKIISMQQHQDFVHLKSTRTAERTSGGDSSIINNNNNNGATDSNSNDSNNIWTCPLTVLYQDDAMVVIVKPQGMAVMGTSNKEMMTLQRCNLLMPLVGTRPVDWPPDIAKKKKKARRMDDDDNNIISKESAAGEGVVVVVGNNKETDDDDDEQMMEEEEEDKILGKPRPAHRLDAATGGVLVVSKTQRVDCILKRIFRERQCHKVYRAIVHGKLMIVQNKNIDNGNGSANNDNDGDEYGICNEEVSGKLSTTFYKPLRYGRASFMLKKRSAVQKQQDDDNDETDDEPRGGGGGVNNDEQMGTWLTVVELKPITGRHHQLRRHLKGLGHAIVGDRRYGPPVLSSVATSGTEGTFIMEQKNDMVDDEQVSATEQQQPVGDKNDDTLSRLCLWAMEITLPHPVTGKETCVGMDEPAWINHVLKLEQERWEQSCKKSAKTSS